MKERGEFGNHRLVEEQPGGPRPREGIPSLLFVKLGGADE